MEYILSYYENSQHEGSENYHKEDRYKYKSRGGLALDLAYHNPNNSKNNNYEKFFPAKKEKISFFKQLYELFNREGLHMKRDINTSKITLNNPLNNPL